MACTYKITNPITKVIESFASEAEVKDYIANHMGDFNTQTRYSKLTGDPISLSDKEVNDFTTFLNKKFNLDSEIINDPDQRWAAKIEGQRVVINQAYADYSDGWHEFSHPLLISMKRSNPDLFNNLYKSLKTTEEWSDISRRAEAKVSELYPEYDGNLSLHQEEVLATAIGWAVGNNTKATSKFLNIINRFIDWVLKALNLDQASKFYVKEIDPNIAFSDFVNLMESDDIKFAPNANWFIGDHVDPNSQLAEITKFNTKVKDKLTPWLADKFKISKKSYNPLMQPRKKKAKSTEGNVLRDMDTGEIVHTGEAKKETIRNQIKNLVINYLDKFTSNALQSDREHISNTITPQINPFENDHASYDLKDKLVKATGGLPIQISTDFVRKLQAEPKGKTQLDKPFSSSTAAAKENEILGEFYTSYMEDIKKFFGNKPIPKSIDNQRLLNKYLSWLELNYPVNFYLTPPVHETYGLSSAIDALYTTPIIKETGKTPLKKGFEVVISNKYLFQDGHTYNLRGEDFSVIPQLQKRYNATGWYIFHELFGETPLLYEYQSDVIDDLDDFKGEINYMLGMGSEESVEKKVEKVKGLLERTIEKNRLLAEEVQEGNLNYLSGNIRALTSDMYSNTFWKSALSGIINAGTVSNSIERFKDFLSNQELSADSELNDTKELSNELEKLSYLSNRNVAQRRGYLKTLVDKGATLESLIDDNALDIFEYKLSKMKYFLQTNAKTGKQFLQEGTLLDEKPSAKLLLDNLYKLSKTSNEAKEGAALLSKYWLAVNEGAKRKLFVIGEIKKSGVENFYKLQKEHEILVKDRISSSLQLLMAAEARDALKASPLATQESYVKAIEDINKQIADYQSNTQSGEKILGAEAISDDVINQLASMKANQLRFFIEHSFQLSKSRGHDKVYLPTAAFIDRVESGNPWTLYVTPFDKQNSLKYKNEPVGSFFEALEEVPDITFTYKTVPGVLEPLIEVDISKFNKGVERFSKLDTPKSTQSYEGQRDQFVERWKLKGVVKFGEFGYVAKSGIATRALADRMKEQLATKSGDLYNNVRIRYDATYGLIKIDPVIKEDLISENQDEVSFSLDNSGQRSYVELPKDFSKVPTTELKANVLSVNPIKTDTYVRGGEYFNVERIRYGTASDLTSFMRVNRDQIESLFKYSRLTPQSIKDFVKDKSEIKFYAYRVTRVEDPEEFINPDEDSAISKFRIAKVTQRNNLRKRRNSVTDETERREIYKEINRITAQIKEISKPKNQNIAFLKAKYEEDKELYANTIPKNIGELKYIDNLFQGYKILFHSTDTTIFGEEVDNEFKQAIKDIDAYQKKLKDNFNKVAIKSMEFKGKLTLTNSDGELLPVSDISFLQSFLLSTSDTTNNPLVKYITNLSYTAISKARDKATREGDVIKKAVNELIKWGKTKGLSGAAIYDFMLEEDGEGKPTGYFAIHYGKFFSQLQKTIKDPKSDKDMVNTYLEFLSKNANNIEIETDKFKAEFQKIYEQKRAQLSLTEEDPRAIEEEALAETTRITYGINPENFIKIFSKYKLSTPLADSEIKFVKTYIDRGGANRFMKVVPKEEFVDPKYAKMMELPENHPQRVFYKLFVEAHYAIGNRMRNDDGSTLRRNFIAEYKRDYKGNDESMIDYLKRDIWDSAVALTTESPRDNIQGVDAITGEILRFIPFYAFDGRIAPEDKNYNLGKVMMNLTKEFAQYEVLSEIEDPLKTAEHILKETKTYATNGIGDRIYIDKEPVFNPDTSNVSKQLDYKILATLYGQRMKKEGVGAKKVYDYKTSQRMKALRELKKNNGEFTLEEEKEYRDLLKKYTVPTVKKSANLLMNTTSILNIGFNLFSGAAELIQANLSVFLRYGAKAWYEDVFTTAINLHTPFDPVAKNKLKGLRKMFNVDGDINAEMKESKFKKVAFATFGPARSIGNTAYLVAVLKDHNIKNKAGEEFRLFDVINFDENGKIVLPEGFDNIFYESDGVTYSQYKYNLGQIVSKEIRDNRDREDALDPIASDQIALGRLVGQFKKSWLFQGFNTRVGGLKEGMNDLDSKSKGIYRSMYDISKGYTEYLDEFGEVQQVFSPLKTLGNIAINLVKYSPIARTLGFGKDNGTHDQLDYEGAVRTARELQTALALYALYIAIAAARANAGPDDPVAKMASTALLNSVMRYQRDASTYFDPNSLASIINKNVIPSLSTITDAYKLLMDPVHGVVSDKWYYNEGQSNEQLRISRDAQDMLPLLNQIRRHMNKLTNNQSIFYNTSY